MNLGQVSPTIWMNLTDTGVCCIYDSLYRKFKTWQNYSMQLEVRIVVTPGERAV